MSLEAVVIVGLAVYRLAQLLVYDDGPGEIVLRLRAWAGVYTLGENGKPTSKWGQFLECPYCVGVWAALVLLPLWYWGGIVGQVFVALWAAAGLAAALETVAGGNSTRD